MSALKFIVILALAGLAHCDEKLKFPDDFLFGTGSSAYQVEGGWNASGKSENIWDDLFHFRKILVFEKLPKFVAINKTGTLEPVPIYYGPKPKPSKLELIDDFMEIWFTGQYQSAPKPPVLSSGIPVGDRGLSYSQANEEVHEIVEKEEVDQLLTRKPEVIGYYKGTPIYEPLPDRLFRKILQLPSPEEVPSEVLYSMYTVDNPELNTPTGDVACDSYNKIDEDIALLKQLGAKIYRFSLSWTRLYPSGNSRDFNQAGIDYYNELIDKLLANKIKPFVTIHHFDLPRHLQFIGGWSNRAMIVYFKIYADFVFKTFGNRVKLWTTINEPTVATEGYKSLNAAPAFGTNMSGVADYLAVHNMILAHATVYDHYQKNYKKTQKGRISVNVAGDWHYAENKTNPADVNATQRALMFQVGIILHPLTFGDYPEIVKSRIKENSERLNISGKRLQEFTDEEKKLIKKSYDFISLNHYMSFMVSDLPENETALKSVGETDSNYKRNVIESEPLFESRKWFKAVPEGISFMLEWIDKTYEHPEIIISENGYPEPEGFDFASKKLDYHYSHLNHILKAINEYKVNVTGYCVWSLMDSLEWIHGYRLKYGIFHVDFNDPNRKRSNKTTTEWFSNVFKNNTLIPPPVFSEHSE